MPPSINFAAAHHIYSVKIHPHAEATYRIITLDDGAFAVEVAIPSSYPTRVSSFASEEAAGEWIEREKERIQRESEAGKWFRKPGRFG